MAPGLDSPAGRFVFLDYLRAIAAWLVVWDHVFAIWPSNHGPVLPLVALTRQYVTEPLGIIQDFGWLAVSLFFLVSGFIITHVAGRETVGEFSFKRVCRIYPPLVVFVLLSLLLNAELRQTVGWLDLLRNFTLTNYLFVPQVITVGVAWTLVIEVLFYIMIAATLGISQKFAGVIVNILFVMICIYYCRSFGDNFFLFTASLAYVPYLLVGQVFYLGVYRRTLSAWQTVLAFAGCYAAILYGLKTIHVAFLPLTNSYLVNFIYASAIFGVLLLVNGRLRAGPVIGFLSATSFAVYLAHGVLGQAAFDAARPIGGVGVAIAAALAATALGATAFHLLMERPLLGAVARLVRRARAVPAPLATSQPAIPGAPLGPASRL